MKKLSLVLALVCFAIGFTMAQRTISGMVNDEKGEALIGASILAKGTSSGTVTDVDGKFSLNLPDGANVLVISYTGFSTQEVTVGNQTTLSIRLVEGVMLETAVVTALNISRDEKSLGYSVQQVGGEDLTRVQETNIVGALAGKIAGVQAVTSAGSAVGGSAKVRVRGVSGLTGGDPLFVVDGTPLANNNFSSSTGGADYGNLASDINPEDIENISVLKGPAATALYGERAKYGVVMVTTKKGRARQGLGITFKSSLSVENVYILPEYQNEYAGGYDQNFIEVVDPVDGKTYQTLDYSADESWGPRLTAPFTAPGGAGTTMKITAQRFRLLLTRTT